VSGLEFDLFVSPADGCMCVCRSNHPALRCCRLVGERSFVGWSVCRSCHDVLRGLAAAQVVRGL
jgi:hypothetical protein